MAEVIEGNNIGHGVVAGVECSHLAFRNQDVDWQLWVQVSVLIQFLESLSSLARVSEGHPNTRW